MPAPRCYPRPTPHFIDWFLFRHGSGPHAADEQRHHAAAGGGGNEIGFHGLVRGRECQKPKDLEAYQAQLAPIDPVNFVGQLAPAPVFFQFAHQDFYVTADEAAEFYAAASPRKQLTTYDADHGLHPPQVAADRMAWLTRELALK